MAVIIGEKGNFMQISSFLRGDNTLSQKERELRELVTYVIVGGMTTFISWAAFYVLDILIKPLDGFDWIIHTKSLFAWVISVSFSYTVSRIWVYQSKKPIMKELISFASSRLFTFFVFDIIGTQICIWIFEDLMKRNKDEILINLGPLPIPWIMLFKVVVGVATIVGNFVLNRVLVFKKKQEE